MLFDFGIKDVIDIFCVAFLLYYIYKLMKASGSLNVFYGILVFIVTWVIVSQVIEMRLMGSIFDKLVSVGVLALIILFQEDIRRFFLTLGSQRRLNLIMRLFSLKKKKEIDTTNPSVLQVTMACNYMSKNLIGALIVLERNMALTDIIKSGEFIDANINTELIKNIFFKNSPLHDGAMIITGHKIAAAACILPVSNDLDIPKHFGLRHRAARGISKETDALAIVVSEETGSITAAYNNKFRARLTAEELELILSKGKF